MGQLKLGEQAAASTPDVGSVVLYPKTDKELYHKNSDGVEVKVTNQPARKNAIINGDFNVWQRGVSFAAVATATYTADRWWYYKQNTAAVHTVSQSTDVPTVAQAGRLFNYSLLVDCTTADASTAVDELILVRQFIEGYNWLPLAQRDFTISFWHKHTKTGTHVVSVGNSNGDRSWVATYTQDASDTWEKATITVEASPSAGTWLYTTGVGLTLDFVINAGTDYHAAAGAWNTTAEFGVSGMANNVDSTANNFRITAVQVEVGEVATDFEQRTFQEELEACQRFYEKSYSQNTYAGATDFSGATVELTSNGSQAWVNSAFRVTKRVPPNVTVYSPSTGASGFVHQVGVSDLAATVTNTGDHSAQIVFNPASLALIQFHWTASAEF